jgi:hypothetical protein
VKRYLAIALAVALLAVLVNDGGQYFNAYNNLNSATDRLLSWAILNAAHGPSDSFAQELGKQAAVEGVQVTRYSLEPQGVHLWTETDVGGTLVLGPYLAMTRGIPFRMAWTTNRGFAVKKDAVAPYR